MNTTVRTLFRLDPDFIPDGVIPPCRTVDPEVFFPIGTGPSAGNAAKAHAQRRRDQDDAFAVEVERLRALGHTDAEIDDLTRGMP